MHKNNRYDLVDNGQGCKIVGSDSLVYQSSIVQLLGSC